ncbi:MAG: putative colanic acid biosynthesis acetyltransferase, partial [Cytophagaceae bacterium]
DNAWVAAEVFIHPGVTIGNGCVIGARSVVVSDMPQWMVCTGHPCKPLKPRVIVD